MLASCVSPRQCSDQLIKIISPAVLWQGEPGRQQTQESQAVNCSGSVTCVIEQHKTQREHSWSWDGKGIMMGALWVPPYPVHHPKREQESKMLPPRRESNLPRTVPGGKTDMHSWSWKTSPADCLPSTDHVESSASLGISIDFASEESLPFRAP